MLELVDNTMFTLEEITKEPAPLGQQIRAVPRHGFADKRGDLKKGNNYQLRSNSDNPKDTLFRGSEPVFRDSNYASQFVRRCP